MRGHVLQKLSLRRRLNVLSNGDSELSGAAGEALWSFDEFYDLTLTTYVQQTGASYQITSDGVILDKILEFFKWMYESGMLEWLLKLFMGMAVDALVVASVHSEFLDALLELSRA